MMKCGICGGDFKDDEFEKYSDHVQKCAAKKIALKKKEEMKKINDELEEVKRAGIVYHGLKDRFKEKYPDIYKANFEGKQCNCHTNKTVKHEDEKLEDLAEVLGSIFGFKLN